jgi:alpha/beta superfamily hydrolase
MSAQAERNPGGELILPGLAGDIEALTAYPPEFHDGQPIAIVCHPHSLHGGSMTNKVVHIIAKTLNELGVATLRFNFRGVGKSAGQFDQGRGEAEDLVALANWFRHKHAESPLWLAGFSFGAYVAARGQQQLTAERLLLVAPPVSMFDFDALGQIEAENFLVIQGGKDEVIQPEAVANWVKGQETGPTFHWMTNADHFFHGRLTRLHDIIIRSWQTLSQ